MSNAINHLITEHIDTWTSAVKQKSAVGRGTNKKHLLYGIKKLRELILELAVRGKLVPQDVNDEPAEHLFARAIEAKVNIANKQKIRKDKEVYNTLKLKGIPSSWKSATIGQITHVLGGKRVPRGYIPDALQLAG